jgi:AcrR family transcriptional regulator
LIDDMTRSQLRDEYLGRLRDLVLAQGLDGLTTDRISAHLKCSKATLYAIWRHKDHLLADVAGSLLADVERESGDRADQVADPAGKVTEYLRARSTGRTVIADRLRRGPATDTGVRQAYATAREASSRRLTAYLRQGVEGGCFRPLDTTFVDGVATFLTDRIESGELPRRAGISATRANHELITLIVSALTNQE